MKLRGVVLYLLHLLGRALSYVYLLRFPLLTACAIVGLCVGAFSSGTRALFGNIFDIDWTWGIFFASWTAFLSGLVVAHTSLLVLLYGRQRFFDSGGRAINSVLVRRSAVLPIFLVLVVALPVVGVAVYISTHLRTGWEVVEVALGFLAALLCSLIVIAVMVGFRVFLRERLPRPTGGSPDNGGMPGSTRQSRFRRISEGTGRGYLEYENGEAVSILPGHVAAAVLLVLTLLLYAVTGWVKYKGLGDPPLFPALSYILLLAMLLCWVLSGAAFFLDRYRIPLLVPLLVWLGLNAFSPWSDYSYPVVDARGEAESSSSNATGKIGADSKGKIIVVAANGGGIQAAAWTAQVLTGLEKECRKECDGSFDKSIHLISSVSGGSIGTMYFLNEYEGGQLPESPDELERIVDRAEGSSLDEISWGVLYPDLIRTFFPNPLVWEGWDRGRALERAWLRHDLDTPWANRKVIKRGLSEWRVDADDRNRPAVIFNTAVVETGQRLPLATTDLPEDSPGDLSYDQYFRNVDPKPDIRVLTAARLSASFPYVSPAARAAVEGETGHIVDGGYYDNYGISSLVEWLDDELENNPKITDVLILEIRGARSGPGDSRTVSRECKTEPVVRQEQGGKRMWFSQLLAPPQGALSVRNTGQRTHNDTELDLLQDKWNGEGDDAKKQDESVEIKRALFEFDGANPPLSWHLTNGQRNAIKQEWLEEVNDPDDTCAGWDRVRAFLSSEDNGRTPSGG